MLQNPFTQTPAKIGVIGLGYVGLPLAVALADKYAVVGFDIDAERIAELKSGHDRTLETSAEELSAATALSFASDDAELRACNVFIVTVPTPIDRYKRPDLTALLSASRTVGRAIGKGGVVIFESTVYPGATEEDCIPVIESVSGLKFNVDFFAGYSPERANPGDRQHRLSTIIKVTAGSTPQAAQFVDALYAAVVPAGTHLASSIRVAEAAKVIENTQRDLNIALINEFALIFNRLGIDTQEVLAAAGTKWNFLKFTPGLVGGHCIGVDPYYLTSKAEDAGYHPQVILAGRRINDGMGGYIAQELVKTMIRREIQVRGARVLVMGLTFKENCPDLRNTRVIDIVRELEEYEIAVDVHEPWADAAEAEAEYGVAPVAKLEPGAYDAIIVAVAHTQFKDMGVEAIRALGKPGAVLYDVKAMFPQGAADLRL
ncbi:Vi polysaccharide biosynthesis protein VipA/TviB [Phenylobacterium sp. Root77]|uniref:nucleotide sugar dehydrogenase n=1 Tax=unclassified Phenylobacterium TaxID=2640670 RepID=UPI0006F2533E|nr:MULTISPECIES: nucleotide sugar dehydrogenase [unclassified Phenylobacterium]KQW70336.1 Vi polysaccharide biosynthesis protein VipA/TviB [Phenylobacterium sp. Root1277]KQW91243.1 Vi polysaccharide biosynthesis protein VipA/TviB [Phenylobacterium sp. Root1290]KRC39120.1 Vi polysaccharide biosynthesis protein VipA/TviB [Phenylobacterium sp. Root77]